MEVNVYDTNLKPVTTIDVFDSVIWTDRYFKHGDFELFVPVSSSAILQLQEDYYLMMEDSDHVMIIESINLKTDVEEGNRFSVTGRSLESILLRRIVWEQTLLSGNFQEAIKFLLDKNAIAPSDNDRKFNRLTFEYSTDENVTLLSVDIQLHGETLYDVISQLCESRRIGFKITVTPTGEFVFKLYAGADRSYSQIENPYVLFSPDMENLTDTDYYHSKIPYKSITLVAGEGEGTARQTIAVPNPNGSGADLDRREMFTDASDISKTTSGGTLTNAQYLTYLTERGLIHLSEQLPITVFDGKIDVLNSNFVYGEDYFLGDIVQIANEYGLTGRSRVNEVVFSQDPSGIDIYPTFITVE